MADVVDLLPRPLYDEIVRGRWLPVVGAGLSRNAIVQAGDPPPDWFTLAERLRPELDDPGDAGDPVDVISSYAHEHGRPALVERVGRSVRVGDAQPAPVHRALCRLPIDLAVTTNFDFLLEKAFDAVGKPCHPVTDEHQLAIQNPYPGPVLYKIHGDMHRPERLILTEEDFDRYLTVNPLYATVVASMVAQRSTVLIGYSLSDPDLRQILAMIRERLGSGARAMYALEVDPSASKTARFARRHIRVVGLPGDRSNPAPTLQRLFDEIFDALPTEAKSRLVPRSHESAIALRSGPTGPTCFLSAPLARQADYEEWVTTAAARRGISIVRLEDFAAPGESLLATVDAVIASVGSAIVDVSSSWTALELGMILNRLPSDRVLLVTDVDAELPSDVAGVLRIARPSDAADWAEFSDRIVDWLTRTLNPEAVVGTRRLNLVGAVMLAAADLETTVGDFLGLPPRARSISKMAEEAFRSELITVNERAVLRDFAGLRNAFAHGHSVELDPGNVLSIVTEVKLITDRLRRRAQDIQGGEDS